MNELRDLYQETILDHNKRPRNFHKMEQCSCYAEGFNPLCGDQLELFLQVENNIIKDASFVGKGCAISTASASLLTEMIKEKTIQDAEQLFNVIHHFLTDEQNNVELSSLGKLAVLAGVKEFPARVKCATLAWHTLHAALQKQTMPVSTE